MSSFFPEFNIQFKEIWSTQFLIFPLLIKQTSFQIRLQFWRQETLTRQTQLYSCCGNTNFVFWRNFWHVQHHVYRSTINIKNPCSCQSSGCFLHSGSHRHSTTTKKTHTCTTRLRFLKNCQSMCSWCKILVCIQHMLGQNREIQQDHDSLVNYAQVSHIPHIIFKGRMQTQSKNLQNGPYIMHLNPKSWTYATSQSLKIICKKRT